MRPEKLTVDFFPHYANHGKTLFIIQNEFGNDGYAFWFKLLEILCGSRNQVYDARNPVDIEFLAAKTHVTAELCIRILDKLAFLGATDTYLWQKRIIWSENLIKNLAPVYAKRKQKIPVKPVMDTGNRVIDVGNADKAKTSGVSGINNPTERVEKLEKREEGTPPIIPPTGVLQGDKIDHTREAKGLLRIYGEIIKSPERDISRTRAKKNILKLLKSGYNNGNGRIKVTFEDLKRAIQNYEKFITNENIEVTFRKNSGNFFGSDEVYQEFIKPDWQAPPERHGTAEKVKAGLDQFKTGENPW